MVGRDDERARLVTALARCRSGGGGLVLVSGEAGVGKSRLVREALSGWHGCRLSATAVAGSHAYAPLTGIVREQIPARRDEGDVGREDPARAILEPLRAAARRAPTVVVLEDLHLADAATIELLPAVAETLESEPLLLLGIYRSDELPRSHPIRALRSRLRRAGRLVDITLRPLTGEQTGELLAALLAAPPAPRLIAAVHDRAEGLPFFIEELAAALRDGGRLVERSGTLHLTDGAALPLPESVLDAVLARTEQLRQEHEAAVELAATLGMWVDLSALAELVGPAEVDALIEAGLLLEADTESAAFRHGLVQEALHRSIPWARRRSHHHRVAELLASRGAAPAIVAEHWIAAHAPEKARPLLLAAAKEHCAAHAYRDAAALAGRALALWPEGEDPASRLTVLEGLADCAELSGELTAAARTWGDVAHRHCARGDLARAGTAHRRAANAAELLGDLSRTAAERLAAAEAFTVAGALGEAAVERLALTGQLKAAGRLTEALEQAVTATDAAAQARRRDLHGHALALQGAVRAALGQGRRGVELARSGLELALSEQLTETAGETCYELGEALEYAADYAAAVEAYESAFELCRSHGLGELATICFVCMSPAARLMGDWDRTLSICAEVLADDRTMVLARRVAEEESGLITALRGDRRRARGPLRRAAEFGQASGMFGLEVGARWGLALVAELDQDDAVARSAVTTLLDRCRTTEECHYALPALRWAASFLGERDDVDGVSACHRVVATLATRNGSPKVLSALAHAGAELAATDGDGAQAAAQFARSAELLAGITAPYERAHTQWRWGQVCAAAGDRHATIATLTSAYRTARRLAARPLARRCATALAEAGEEVDPRLGRLAARTLEPAGLTRREQEVLRHLAGGRTNREIAAELFLSTRTIDMHVRNVFTKLDCSSRTTAVRRATTLGLLPADS
jgi:DNA-binding CsgD family transcriptional regulator